MFDVTAERRKNMNVMSTALKGSMHKPLASCMWIFYLLKTGNILINNHNALLMHCGVNRLQHCG